MRNKGQVVVEMIFVAHAGPNSGYQLQTPSQESIVHLTTESYDLSWNACRRLSNCSHDNNRYPVSPSFGDHDFLMGSSDCLASKSKYFPCAVIRWSWPDSPPFITATCHSRSIAATAARRADTRRGDFSVGSLDRVGCWQP